MQIGNISIAAVASLVPRPTPSIFMLHAGPGDETTCSKIGCYDLRKA